MPNIDNETLLVALQAVYESVNRFEALLTSSETLSDPENITELLIEYDEALRVLKGVYQAELQNGANLPPLESILIGQQ